MTVVKAVVLLIICAIDMAAGVYMAWVFGSVAMVDGAATIVTTDNAGYMFLTLLMLGVPLLVWLLRRRASYTTRVMLAALPIGLFFALGGSFWVRLK